MLSDLYGQVGDLCVAQHKNQDAIAAYEESIKLNEKNATALNNYAYFLLGLEQPSLIEKAVRLASKAVALHPNDFRLLDTYGFALFLQRDYLQAEIYLRRAIERAEAAQKRIHRVSAQPALQSITTTMQRCKRRWATYKQVFSFFRK